MIGKYFARAHGLKTVSIVAGVGLIVAAATLNVFSQSDKRGSLPAPGFIANVTSAADSIQSYALYLPSTYVASRRWPIIYFFDPGGRGERPVELYKSSPRSTDSSSLAPIIPAISPADQAASVNAIWQDTHLRLAMDEHRTFVSGFSGGARVAGAMALSCSQCHIAGMVAFGAGYPTTARYKRQSALLFRRRRS